MMRKVSLSLALVCQTIIMSVCLGQVPFGHKPPKILFISYEELRSGLSAAHERLEGKYVDLFKTAKWPTSPWIGMSSATGTAECVFMIPYDSYKAMEADRLGADNQAGFSSESLDLAHDKFMTQGVRNLWASLRSDLSYKPEEFVRELGHSRYLHINTYRVIQGKDLTFTSSLAQILQGFEKSGYKHPTLVYQIDSGMQTGTYLTLTPYLDAGGFDSGEDEFAALFKALGPEAVGRVFKASNESVAYSDSQTFILRPSMSYLPDDFVAMDPQFWRPKKSVTTSKPRKTKKPKKSDAKDR